MKKTVWLNFTLFICLIVMLFNSCTNAKSTEVPTVSLDEIGNFPDCSDETCGDILLIAKEYLDNLFVETTGMKTQKDNTVVSVNYCVTAKGYSDNFKSGVARYDVYTIANGIWYWTEYELSCDICKSVTKGYWYASNGKSKIRLSTRYYNQVSVDQNGDDTIVYLVASYDHAPLYGNAYNKPVLVKSYEEMYRSNAWIEPSISVSEPTDQYRDSFIYGEDYVNKYWTWEYSVHGVILK